MKKEKDCLILSQFFYPEYVSTARLATDVAMAVAESGINVDVICGYPKEYTDRGRVSLKEEHGGVNIARVRYFQPDRSSFLGRCANSLSLIASILLRLPAMSGYKAVFVYSAPPLLPMVAILAKKLFGCRVIFISYDVYPEIGIETRKIRGGGLVDKCFRIINRGVEKNADVVVACSRDMKEFWESERDLRHGRVVAIPNWCEDGDIRAGGERSGVLSGIVGEGDFLVSYLGNLGTCQDMDTILDCARSMRGQKSVHFLFAGHGNKMERLREIAGREGLGQVHVLPYLQGGDYDAVLSRSDAFIASLVPNLRGLCSPSKVSGYLMAGKPVIAIMDRGMDVASDIERGGCGYVIRNGESGKLAEKIEYLRAHEEERSRMGASGRKVFLRKYEKGVCLGKYVRLAEIACSKPSGRPSGQAAGHFVWRD